MINNCANSRCAKPLRYLREGKIFVFDLPDGIRMLAEDKVSHHLEHFWLCGDCAKEFLVERRSDTEPGVRIVPR
jgi:hypothetical protein